jgi:molybdopterin/thiamine biosynthesis adenylyltransferase
MIFSRQIAFWGEQKQSLLERACIFVAGVGGLGCLLSEIMVRSGIGKLYICDNGVIEVTDLNRQILYTQKDIGKPKIDVAFKKLSEIHSFTKIVPLNVDIKDKEFILPSDISGVADCLDNFGSRFTLWDKLGTNNFYVHAGVERFYGQVATLIKGKSPSLRDVFSNYDENSNIIPVCAYAVSVVSSLAATEVIKNIFTEPSLFNQLLIIDLSDFTFSKIGIK